MVGTKANRTKKVVHEIPPRIANELAILDNIKPEGYYPRIKHFANLGDIISILPAIKKYWEITGREAILVQVVGQIAQYYSGATHPTVNADGQPVCINDAMYDMILPLVESQPYIHKMEKYVGQKIDLDFDVIRGKTFVGLPNLMIQSWVSFAFPDLACNLSKPWITIPDRKYPEVLKQVKNKIILNYTERYRNDLIDYFFLKSYAPDLIFAGTEREYFLFCNKWQLTIPRLQVSNFLEYAYAIKNSRFILGCQTFGWNVAQGLDHPRIVELCRFAPNVQPSIGEDSYGFFHQVGAEYYMKVLYNKTLKNS